MTPLSLNCVETDLSVQKMTLENQMQKFENVAAVSFDQTTMGRRKHTSVSPVEEHHAKENKPVDTIVDDHLLTNKRTFSRSAERNIALSKRQPRHGLPYARTFEENRKA